MFDEIDIIKQALNMLLSQACGDKGEKVITGLLIILSVFVYRINQKKKDDQFRALTERYDSVIDALIDEKTKNKD